MEEAKKPEARHVFKRGRCGGGSSDGVYGLAFVGALIYYVQHAETFGQGALGVLKAVVWPAMLVYELMGFLQM